MIALAEKNKNLVAVDLTGCDELITGDVIRAFADHGSLEVLVLPSCYNICPDDVEYVVIRCKLLRYIVLHRGLRMWILATMLDNISSFCELHWR